MCNNNDTSNIDWNKTNLKLFLSVDCWSIGEALIVLSSLDPKQLHSQQNYSSDQENLENWLEPKHLLAKDQYAETELITAYKESQKLYDDLLFIWQGSEYNNEFNAEFGFLESPAWYFEYYGEKGFYPNWKQWATTNIPNFTHVLNEVNKGGDKLCIQ